MRGWFGSLALSSALALGYSFTARSSLAQELGTPPPEAAKTVAASKERDVLKIEKAPEGVTGSVSAGGLTSSGNSSMLAFTGAGQVDVRYGKNGYGASLVRNAPAPGGPPQRAILG